MNTRGHRRQVKCNDLLLLTAIGLCAISFSTHAQFTVGGQLMLRSEYRNGYGKLIQKDQQPAFLIGQRARIQTQYEHEKVNFFVSIQDVRTWGSTPQVKSSDGYFSIHEAWGELVLGKNWKAKLGRQELNYDNVRFLGNLDWALQARAHDFALVKYEQDLMKVHFGAGYNQVNETLVNQPYTMTNQYKTAQMLRVENQWGNMEASFLFWNNGMAQLIYDTLGKPVDETIRYSQTLGLPTLRYKSGNFTLSGFYYLQVGRDITTKSLRAHNVSAQASYTRILIEEKGRKIQSTVGFELLTGTSQQATDNINRSYNPFYGTNHAHNGYMDFFYVGGRYVNSVGLQDFFLRLRYDVSQKLFLSLNGHHFLAAADVVDTGDNLSSLLGTELDFTAGWLLNDVVSLQVGYSQMWATDTFKFLQGSVNTSALQNWAYAALLVRPNMKNRFVGLIF
ncbi:MAG: alginate export family protein [Bacteroidota bacterium]